VEDNGRVQRAREEVHRQYLSGKRSGTRFVVPNHGLLSMGEIYHHYASETVKLFVGSTLTPRMEDQVARYDQMLSSTTRLLVAQVTEPNDRMFTTVA
jgi:hypothetical protein